MQLGVNNSYMSFGKAKPEEAPVSMKNGELSFSVVNPPDKLPKSSLYNEVYAGDEFKYSNDPTMVKPLNPHGDKQKAGSFCAKMTFVSALLAGLSLLFLKKKH